MDEPHQTELAPARALEATGSTRPTDILWLVGALLLSFVVQLALLVLGHVSLVNVALGIVWLALIAGGVIGAALFSAVQFAGAPRVVWLGVAGPALFALILLPAIYLMIGEVVRSIGWGWYLNVLILSAGASLGAFAGSRLARSTRSEPKFF